MITTQDLARAMQETQDSLKRLEVSQAKTDEQMKKTDVQMKKTDEKLERMGITLGNTLNNQGDVAEAPDCLHYLPQISQRGLARGGIYGEATDAASWRAGQLNDGRARFVDWQPSNGCVGT